MRDHVLWQLPYPVRVLVGLLIHRNTVSMLHGQGVGRLSAEEIALFRGEIWEHFSDLLADRRTPGSEPFWLLGGKEPTEADASLFGFIVSALICKA
jgi:hypothetical protein